jgi:MFS transporter, MFS domain-containing protein family, molybdate-anion transporter
MMCTWNENRGTSPVKASDVEDKSAEEEQSVGEDRSRTTESLRDPRVWVLSFVSCCFQGTMFLLMFFWTGALQEAHNLEKGLPSPSGPLDRTSDKVEKDPIPHGVIFACFMGAMVLGALLFNVLAASATRMTVGAAPSIVAVTFWGRVRAMLAPTPTHMLTTALLLASVGFILAGVWLQRELALFCAFLLLEACNGVYVPSTAYHRGTIVGDSGRASVYGLMNIPLFVFVVVALALGSWDEGKFESPISSPDYPSSISYSGPVPGALSALGQ